MDQETAVTTWVTMTCSNAKSLQPTNGKICQSLVNMAEATLMIIFFNTNPYFLLTVLTGKVLILKSRAYFLRLKPLNYLVI